MTVPDAVHELVSKFDQYRQEYQTHKNETELRREFLDPFFEALGWDVFNKKSFSERFKEVLHEASVEVEGQAKAADYAFRVGDKTIFLVEAKKPSVNIGTNPETAFQLRRYGWSAKLPISILTDFEQLAVYECQTKPSKTDKASFGRIKLYHCSEYVEKWYEIAEVFSHSAVMKGAFDKFVEGTKGKKGTEQVDDAFLEEIERWRDMLARNIALRNEQIRTERELNFAVQMIIDRIVFLRIGEDRGIEPEGQLQRIGSCIQIYRELVTLFRRADTRYNSGLFHFSEEKGQSSSPDSLTPGLQIDDKILKDILKNLYYPESPYVFTYLSADILGQVYERFLGKVIRLTAGHQAKVEEKPEVRKAGGVYYTPTYIVNYIVENTVGKLLEGKTPKQAESIKVLDPACGSGSFLLGAYQYLLDWHVKWYSENDPEKWAKGGNPVVYQAVGGDWRLTTVEKKRILLDNIHGVDIDAQAVEVTKLSLLLKVLEGESGQLRLGFERALPDLGRNIQCGNSLIGPDYYEGHQMTIFIDQEERYRVNAFDWQTAFPQVFTTGGFDVVIGNPPYGASFTPTEENYFTYHYKTFSGTKDVYTCFIENATKVMNSNGRTSFIVPSGWTGGPQYTKLRTNLLTFEFEKIVLLPFDIFEDAYVDTLIFVLNNNSPSPDHLVQTFTYPKREKITSMDIQVYKDIKQSDWNLADDKKFVLDPETIGLLHNLSKTTSRKINDVCLMRRGVLFDSSLLSDKRISDKYYRYFEGDVYRYQINLVIDRWVEFGEKMKERPKEFFWFEGQRLLLRRLVNRRQRLMSSITDETFITNKNLYSLIPKGINGKVLLAVLNSRLLSYLYIRQVTQAVKDDFPQVTIKDILSLPFPSDDKVKKAETRIVSLVERMLEMYKRLSSPRTPQEQEMVKREIESTNKGIDGLVYGLYGLTEEEIKIVESK